MIDVWKSARCDAVMVGIFGRLKKWIPRFGGARSDEEHGSSSGHGAASDSTRSGQEPRLNHEPRRYKRALLLAGRDGIQQEIASAVAEFRGREYAVLDLSHSGAAIERGELTDAELPDTNAAETMTLRLGLLEPFRAQVTLARHAERILAFEFLDVETEGRLKIDRFLDPKMIGLNMRTVDRSFFSPGETFSVWFCGPRDTNFFLWTSGSRLDRAIIQLGDEQFALASSAGAGSGVRFTLQTSSSSRAPTQTLRDSVLFALDVALQIKGGGEAIAGLVKLLTEAADRVETAE